MSIKKRLDILVQEKNPDLSRTQIQSLIMQGKVSVSGKPVTKPGQQFPEDAEITLTLAEQKYVSRAGYKLERALDHFNVDVNGLVVLDAGLSTGGFTDCLLQRGAAKIYGVDVGYGQVHEKIRKDPRVVVIERTNLRHLEQLAEPVGPSGAHPELIEGSEREKRILVDLVTLDLSFISMLKVIDAVKNLMKPHGQLIALIKPQFEAGKEQVGPGGIIKDPKVHAEVVERVKKGLENAGFDCSEVIDSPIEGTSGNKEFLIYCKLKS